VRDSKIVCQRIITDKFLTKAKTSMIPQSFLILQCVPILMCLIVISASPPFTDRRHWGRKENPFRLNIVKTLTPGWNDELEGNLVKWAQTSSDMFNEIFEFNIISSSNNNATERLNCKPIRGKIRICDSNDYQQHKAANDKWVAKTMIRVTKHNLIVSAVIKIDTSLDYWNNAYFGERARDKVLCHEIGHTLGVDHPSTDGLSHSTCMDYSNVYASLSPNVDDYATLTDLYGVVDTKNTYGRKGENGVTITKYGVDQVSERSNSDSNTILNETVATSTVVNGAVQVSGKNNSDSNTFFNETIANSTVVNGTHNLNSTILNGTDILNGTHHLNNTTTNGPTTLSSTQILNNTIIQNIGTAGIYVQPSDEMLCINSNDALVSMEENAFSASYVEECGDELIFYEILKPRSIGLFHSNLRKKISGKKKALTNEDSSVRGKNNYFNEKKLVHVRRT